MAVNGPTSGSYVGPLCILRKHQLKSNNPREGHLIDF